MKVPRVVFVFVDGLGVGEVNPQKNPVYDGASPHLEQLIREQAVPLDATLGVKGIPQSATGQTALLTGVNAPRQVGRHIEGFPTEELKEIVRDHNVFKQLRERGYCCTFANCYYIDSLESPSARRRHSVTTVATLAGIGSVRLKDTLERGQSVYHDITREALRSRGYDGPVIDPSRAAEDLIGIALQHDFTLFEFFQTDIHGHRGTEADVRQVLRKLDEFIQHLLQLVPQHDIQLIITSDHGNIEDSASKTHTYNPVPFIAVGPDADALKFNVSTLTDVVPALMGLYPEK